MSRGLGRFGDEALTGWKEHTDHGDFPLIPSGVIPFGGISFGELPPLFLGNHWWRNCSSRWCNGSTYSYNSVPSSRTFTTVTAPAKCSSKPLIIPLQPLGYDEN
ncbi:hypothetical protein ACOMHN_010389 [Nucella lapillus]